MARTYKTVSLSLPPSVVEALQKTGAATSRTAARVAAEIVKRDVTRDHADGGVRQLSWCCSAKVVPTSGQLVLPATPLGDRRWVPVTALFCVACSRQLHGREYEGWLESGVQEALASTGSLCQK